MLPIFSRSVGIHLNFAIAAVYLIFTHSYRHKCLVAMGHPFKAMLDTIVDATATTIQLLRYTNFNSLLLSNTIQFLTSLSQSLKVNETLLKEEVMRQKEKIKELEG